MIPKRVGLLILLLICQQTAPHVSCRDVPKNRIGEFPGMGGRPSQRVVVTEEMMQNLRESKPYMFEGMNSYVKFREGLNKVIKLEQFMSYFDSRKNGCCSSDTSASQQKLSGYFDGQWRLLDSSPGLQAALAKDEHRDKSGNKNGRDPTESFRRMQWFTNYFGHDKLSEDYKKWQLGKLGQDFVSRGFAQGKANFALQFDEVIQDNGMSNQIIENIQTQYHNDQQMEAENPLKDGDEKAKALAAANLKKNIVIAQFLNQDFSS